MFEKLRKHQTAICLILISGCLCSCSENESFIPSEPLFFLKGVLNDFEEIDLQYYLANSNQKYIMPSGGFSSDPESDYNIQGVGCSFIVDKGGRSNNEFYDIEFNFKFDTALFEEGEKFIVKDLEQLSNLLAHEDWNYHNKDERYVTIKYQIFQEGKLWITTQTENDPYSKSSFTLDNVSFHQDPIYGEGLLVTGSFDCELRDYYNNSRRMTINDAEFRGFLKVWR